MSGGLAGQSRHNSAAQGRPRLRSETRRNQRRSQNLSRRILCLNRSSPKRARITLRTTDLSKRYSESPFMIFYELLIRRDVSRKQVSAHITPLIEMRSDPGRAYLPRALVVLNPDRKTTRLKLAADRKTQVRCLMTPCRVLWHWRFAECLCTE